MLKCITAAALAVALAGSAQAQTGHLAPTPPAPSPQATPSPPTDETALIHAVENARSKYNAGQTDFQRGATRPERRMAICNARTAMRAKDWLGTVATLSTNGDGMGVLGVRIGKSITVTTWNNALSDFSDHTLITAGSAVYGKLSSLKVGDTVKFSGYFVQSDTDCIRESSMTLGGSMTDPEFIFQFSVVEKVDVPTAVSAEAGGNQDTDTPSAAAAVTLGLIVVAICLMFSILASNRGRSGWGWFFLSLLITPVLSFILLLALPKQDRRA
jgi:hypothetical protein